MFTSKKSKLFDAPSASATSGTSTSTFVSAAMKKGAETRSENGALKYSTTGNDFV